MKTLMRMKMLHLMILNGGSDDDNGNSDNDSDGSDDNNGSCNDDDIGDDQVPRLNRLKKSSFDGERKTFRHLMKHLFLMLTILRKPNPLLSILGSSGLMK